MQGTEHKHGGRRPRGARWFATLALLFVASSAVAASLLRMASLALQDTSAISSYPLQTISDFSEGRMAMFSGSAGDVGQIEDADPNFEWRSTFIPRFEKYAVPTGGPNAPILTKDGAKQEAAWKFIAWFTSTDQTIECSQKTGYLPVKEAAGDDPEMVEYFEENPNHKVPVEQLEYARSVPESSDYPEVLKNVQTAMDNILYNDKLVGPALEEAERKSSEVLSGS